MNFIKHFKLEFPNISDTQNCLYTSSGNVVLTSIKCTNISDNNIRLTAKINDTPIAYNRLVGINQTTDMLFGVYSDKAELVESRMVKDDKLYCYSDGYSKAFSCLIVGYEEVENLPDSI